MTFPRIFVICTRLRRPAGTWSQMTIFYVLGMTSSNSGPNLKIDVIFRPGIDQTPDEKQSNGQIMSSCMLLIRTLDDLWTKSWVHFKIWTCI